MSACLTGNVRLEGFARDDLEDLSGRRWLIDSEQLVCRRRRRNKLDKLIGGDRRSLVRSVKTEQISTCLHGGGIRNKLQWCGRNS